MNNDQFRRLLVDGGDKNGASPDSTRSGSSHGQALGSRKSAFIPRHIQRGHGGTGGAALFRQATGEKQKPAKIRRVKLAEGYQDRALERLNAEEEKREEDEKVLRLKALADQVKEGKLSAKEFEQLREEIAGGDVSSTHLVKGLDRRLLERVRRGENVMADGNTEEPTEDVEDEFEDLETKEVHTVQKETKVKKGEIAKVPMPVAGGKRTRDDILRELKAQREAEAQARAAARPELGDRFKAIESDKPKVMIDKKGREVIITRDEHGKIKKKVRKISESTAPVPETRESAEVELPAEAALEEHEQAPVTEENADQSEAESEPIAMFEDAGSDYDPLAGLNNDDDSSGEDEKEDTEKAGPSIPVAEGEMHGKLALEEDESQPMTRRRNYFDTTDPEPEAQSNLNPLSDPSFLSAITRASALAKAKNPSGSDSEDEETRIAREEKEARLAKKREALLASSARDLDDMDLGFGGGRFDEDDDEDDGGRIKLSKWGGGGDDDESHGGNKAGGPKKKRSRKRKGDKNDAKDVLEVMRRQAEKGK